MATSEGVIPPEKDPVDKCTVDHGVKERMLSRVANSDAHFQHQQRGEPDLTCQQKLEICTDLLVNKPVIFLSRFGKYLHHEDLSYFSHLSHQYEVHFYLQEIQRNLDCAKSHQKVRNRRYEAMKQLMIKTDYFQDEEMKSRDPLLYDQMVGQYLLDDEIIEQSQKCGPRISQMFLQHLQGMQNTDLFERLKDVEEGQEEEEEDEEEEEEEEDMDLKEPNVSGSKDEDVEICEDERRNLKTEFLRIMQLRFLNGEDDYDYSTVDENTEFDSLDVQEQEDEEKYFDNDDNMETEYTAEPCASYEASDAEDYENYKVNEDICPGLNKDANIKDACETKSDVNSPDGTQ